MRMSLAAKGKIQAKPVLQEPYERVSREIASWPNIISATHWHLMHPTQIDGADFYVDEVELGHIHLNGELHIAFEPALSKPLVRAKLARRFKWGGSAGGWAESTIRSTADTEHAIWLFRLNYDHITGTPIDDLLSRIDGQVVAA